MKSSPMRRPSGRTSGNGNRLLSIAACVVTLILLVGVPSGLFDAERREGAIRRAVLTVEDSLGGLRGVYSGSHNLLEGSIGDEDAELNGDEEQTQFAGTGGGSASAATISKQQDAPLPGEASAKYPSFCKHLSPPQVPDIMVQQIWRSKKQRKLTDVTLVTQLSIDRLNALATQCSVWGGVISAAVYVPLVDNAIVSEDSDLSGSAMETAIAAMEAFNRKQESEGRCVLDTLLISEEVVSLRYVGLYPVNALRNRALQLASTDILLLLDADFIPNRDLSDDLANPQMYDILHRATSAHQAIVLPAFQILAENEAGRRLALKAVETKEDVVGLMHSGKAQGFHMDGFVNGHRATEFEKWAQAEISYRAHYEEGFEPYVLVQRSYVPWYDERFKGYRKNKVVHLMHMHSMGMNFVVTPRAWVVHVPHQEADTWRVTRETGYWKKLQRLYQIVKKEMDQDTFVPSVGFNCEGRHASKWSWYR